MKNIKNISVSIVTIIISIITIAQVPVSKAAAISLVTGPITSAVTPTVTPTATPTPTIVANTTPTPTVAQQNENKGSDNSNNSNNTTSAPVCNTARPAQVQVNGVYATGSNEVTIFWNRLNENATYYLIAYGRKQGLIEYASAPISSEASSYIIKGLSAKTPYYFSVRAGNGCMPGEFSSPITTKAYGKAMNKQAEGFNSAVSGANNKKQKTGIKVEAPTKKEAQKPNGGNSENFIVSFFKKLFKS